MPTEPGWTHIRVMKADQEWIRREAFERRISQGALVHEALELYRTTPEFSRAAEGARS